MQKLTRQRYNAYLAEIAKLNNIDVATVAAKFNVEPTVQQRLENRIQESSDFLRRINIIGVTEQEGAKVGMGVNGPIAGRTDTTRKERQTRDVSDLDERGYRCEQTNYDTHIRYAQLDAWAKFKDFQTRLRDMIIKQQALDRIMIGFHGERVARDTDLAANPLLQDVNKGWFQHLREQAPERVMTHGKKEADQILIGKGGDYANLDALVYDAVNNLLDPWFAEDPALVVICGRKLLADKYFPIVNQNHRPSETLAADLVISQKRIGNLPAVRVPFFPPQGLMVTRLDNLSIYYQESARRRHLKDKPERDRIENYESSNDAYVIEQLGCVTAAENITLLDEDEE